MNVSSFIKGLGILAVGVVGLLLFVLLRPEPGMEEPLEFAPVVETVEAVPESGVIRLQASGTVSARRDVALSAEVPGSVVWTHRSFATGGTFRRGDILIRLDSTDYVNAVTMATAELTQRTFDAIVAQQEAEIARADWERLKARDADARQLELPEETALGSLLFREPQMRLAEAARQAAAARLEDARARLERSRIRAPFDGRIRSTNVNQGSYVAPGMVLASFYSTDVAEIQVPISSRDAELFENVQALGARRAEVVVSATNGSAEWTGFVARTSGALNPQTRMLDVVVQVNNPYAANPPLLVGSFVNVAISARTVDGFFRLPVELMRADDTGQNGTVWVFDDGTLRIRRVSVLTEQNGEAIVTGGIEPGERIIRTNLSVVTDGMTVRTTAEPTPNPAN